MSVFLNLFLFIVVFSQWHIFTVPDKKICWGIQVQLKNANAADMAFRNTEWGPEGNEDMIKEVYDFPTPYGPLGQFIDATPRNRISKVFLEEKLFETWYHGRTVLIGDGRSYNPCFCPPFIDEMQCT